MLLLADEQKSILVCIQRLFFPFHVCELRNLESTILYCAQRGDESFCRPYMQYSVVRPYKSVEGASRKQAVACPCGIYIVVCVIRMDRQLCLPAMLGVTRVPDLDNLGSIAFPLD